MDKKKMRRIVSLLLISAMVLACAACGSGGSAGGSGEEMDKGDSANAASMWLVKTEGTVAVADGEGAEVALTDKLGLFSGYGVTTQAASYGWIDLDETKLTKMDESSAVSVEKDGKALTLTVDSGSLFFNITEPLAEDESLEIRTSTMVTAIRGTCGWVDVPDGDHMNVYILEGTVTCSVGDGAASESVTAGEMARLSSAGGPSVTKEAFSVDDIPGFVTTELEGDEALCAAILDASGLDILNPGAGGPLTYETHRTNYDVGSVPAEIYYDGLTIQGTGAGIEKINELFRQLEQDFFDDPELQNVIDAASKPNAPYTPYSYTGGLSVTYNDKGILCVTDSHSGYTGGAHGWVNGQTYALNVKTAEQAYLNDLLEGTDEEIVQTVIDALEDEYGQYNIINWDVVKGYSPQDFKFRVTDTGITVNFDPGEIAYNAAGPLSVEIPL